MPRVTHDADFDRFWRMYPLRVGKLSAQKAYTKSRQIASAEQLEQGVLNYVRTKPTWQQWAHPASWLNAGRWLDEGPARDAYAPWVCPHTPHCPHRPACAVVSARKK